MSAMEFSDFGRASARIGDLFAAKFQVAISPCLPLLHDVA
jgi:hypothetical protein